MEKRYVLALVLMVAVMFGWSWFYGRKLPKPEQTTEQATEQSREASPLSPDSSFSGEATVDTTQSAQVEVPSRSRQPVRENQTVHVETGKYHIIFQLDDSLTPMNGHLKNIQTDPLWVNRCLI